MPSGFGGMGRGSDTRMYAPRSESSRMYASDDDDSYRHGAGDAEEQERRRDEKMRRREETKTVGDTPHLQITVDKPDEDPMMGGMEEPQQEEEDPNMYNPEQDAMASDMSAMAGALGTGGPDLSQALGAQTNGVMGGYRPLVATGEPMDVAFRLLKTTEMCYTCQGSGEIDVPFDSGPPITCTNCGGLGVIRSKHPGSEDERQSIERQIQHIVGSAPVEGMKLEQGRLEPSTYNAPVLFNTRTDKDETPTFGGIPYNENTYFTTGEPMDGAWSTLMKADGKPFQQPKFEGPPGGRKPHIATSIRSKRQSRTLSPRTEHGGTTEAPLAVEMGHLGLSTKQPLRLFPAKYRQQLGQRQQHSLMGNITMPYQTHNIEQRTPSKPGPMGAGKIARLAGETKKAELKEMNTLLKSAKDYLHISQLRRMIRDLKKIVERQDRMKKAPLSRGSNKNKESNHRGETTNPQGATDDPKSDEMSSSGHAFVARGGRVG